MSTHAKLAIPIFLIFGGYLVYLLTADKGLAAFENVRASGEINQTAKLLVVADRGFQRNANNQITTFYVQDRNGRIAVVNMEKPAPEEITTAKVIELFGHMHGNEYVGKRVEIVDDAGYE